MKKNKSKQIESNVLRETLEFVCQIFAIVILALFPLIPGTQSVYGNITVSKYVYFIVAVSLFVVAIAYFMATSYPKIKAAGGSLLGKIDADGNVHKFRLDLTQWLLIAFVVWSFISACVSKYSWEDKLIGQSRYEALLSIILYAVVFLLISIFGQHTDIILYCTAVMSFIMGLIATMQCLGSKILYPGDYTYFNSTFLATIGHQDCYSGFISMIIPVLFCAFVFLEDKKRYMMLPGMFFMMFAQLFSDVDSGKIGLLAAFIVILPFVLDSERNIARSLKGFGVLLLAFAFYGLFKTTKADGIHVTAGKTFVVGIVGAAVLGALGVVLEKAGILHLPNQKTMRLIITIILVIAIIAALIVVYTYSGNNKLVKEASQLLHGKLTDKMGTIRGYIWKATGKIIKENPIFGVGPGCYKAAFEPYNEGYQKYAPNTVVDFAHNDYLQIASCEGLVGLVIYLAFVISLVVKGIVCVCKQNDNERGKRVVIYLAGCIGFLAHTLFGFSIAIISPIFWVMAGVMEKVSRE